jgi:hypothetical protein
MNDVVITDLQESLETMNEHLKITFSNIIAVTSRQEIISNEEA